MGAVKNINIHELSTTERISLAEELWGSIAEHHDQIAVTDAQKKVLDERLEAYKASPEEGSSWNNIKDKMK